MPRFSVTVTYEQAKDIEVWAPDELEAAEKAQAIVEKWNGVLSAEAGEVEEIDA